jgi:hypothetical protein
MASPLRRSLHLPKPSGGAVLRSDENTCRKDMTVSERVAWAQLVEELERPKATDRQGARTDLSTLGSTEPNVPKAMPGERGPRSADVAASPVAGLDREVPPGGNLLYGHLPASERREVGERLIRGLIGAGRGGGVARRGDYPGRVEGVGAGDGRETGRRIFGGSPCRSSWVWRKGRTSLLHGTGARAMATALVLAEDGRRHDGRWKRGSVLGVDVTESRNTWKDALRAAGLVIDHAPELAEQVVAGELALDAAYRQAEERRDAGRAKQESEERLAAEDQVAGRAVLLSALVEPGGEGRGHGAVSLIARYAGHVSSWWTWIV